MTQQCTTHICSTVLCLSFFQCFFISHFKCVHGLLYAGGVVSRWCLHTFLHHFTIQILKIAGMFVAVLGTMAHIRRIFFSLDKTQVQDALRSAGMEADIDPRGHKAMQPEQSHGRWQVNGPGFEVHPGYSARRECKQPDLLIVQGRKGWNAEILTRAEDAIRQSCRKGSRSRSPLAPGKTTWDEVASTIRGRGSQQGGKPKDVRAVSLPPR